MIILIDYPHWLSPSSLTILIDHHPHWLSSSLTILIDYPHWLSSLTILIIDYHYLPANPKLFSFDGIGNHSNDINTQLLHFVIGYNFSFPHIHSTTLAHHHRKWPFQGHWSSGEGPVLSRMFEEDRSRRWQYREWREWESEEWEKWSSRDNNNDDDNNG